MMRALSLLLIFCSAGCTGSAKKRETASLVAALEHYLRAGNAERPAAVAPLRSVQCTVAEVCDARTACLQAAESTARALTLKSQVAGALSRSDGGAPAGETETHRLQDTLADALAELQAGHKMMPVCEERVAALRREAGL